MSTRNRSQQDVPLVPLAAVSSVAFAEVPRLHSQPEAIRSVRRASLVAGVALALMAVLSAFAVFGALGGLGTPGDAARAVRAVTDSEGLFRWGIACLFMVVVLDVIVAAALLEVFTPVSRSVSMLAAWFRLAYAAVFLVAIGQLVGMLPGSSGNGAAAGHVQAVDEIWHAGLILFGVHLVLIGYLAYRSGFVHKIFGILLVVAGLSYLADSFGTVLVSGSWAGIAQFTFVGEVALIFWLLIRGSRLTSMGTTTAEPSYAIPLTTTAAESPDSVAAWSACRQSHAPIPHNTPGK